MGTKLDNQFLARAIDEYVDLAVDIFHVAKPPETDLDRRLSAIIERDLDARLAELQKLSDWLRDIAADLRKAE